MEIWLRDRIVNPYLLPVLLPIVLAACGGEESFRELCVRAAANCDRCDADGRDGCTDAESCASSTDEEVEQMLADFSPERVAWARGWFECIADYSCEELAAPNGDEIDNACAGPPP